MPVLTAGFTPTERVFVGHVSWYFIPWIVIVVPYYALSAHLKAAWQFSWVFGAEIVVMVVSIVILWFDHTTVAALPIAYGGGYAVAALLLLARRGFRRVSATVRIPHLLNSMSKQYLATQVGTATGFADRYFQSFLIPGGISALGYVGLIVNSLSSLMTFREIYVVPLASEIGREQKLERMLQGLVLISIPCTLFLVIYAEQIVSVLLQRGKFTADAVVVTAASSASMALSLLVSTACATRANVSNPRQTLFHANPIPDRAGRDPDLSVHFPVFYLALDVQGIAWGSVCTGIVVLGVGDRHGAAMRHSYSVARHLRQRRDFCRDCGCGMAFHGHRIALHRGCQLIVATGFYGLVVA